MPGDYYSYGGFSFLARPRGELYLSSGTNVTSFDIAFDSSGFDDGEEPNRFFNVNTTIRANNELSGTGCTVGAGSTHRDRHAESSRRFYRQDFYRS